MYLGEIFNLLISCFFNYISLIRECLLCILPRHLHCVHTKWQREVMSSPWAEQSHGLLLLLLFSCQVVSDSLQPHGLQHSSPPCLSSSPGVCPSSWSLNWRCHPTISSSVAPFSSCFQSLPASGSFPMSWLFTSGGQSIGASVSASDLPKSIKGWFPLGLTDLISLLSKGLSRAFSSTTVRKHQFFGALPSLSFRTEKGVQQGCLLSPCLFNLYAEHIMWNAGLDELQDGSRL